MSKREFIENANERFERMAEEFDADTGFMAPGKDFPAAAGNSPHADESYRQDVWHAWLKGLARGLAEAKAKKGGQK